MATTNSVQERPALATAAVARQHVPPMSKVKALPKRSEVKPADRWNLASLYPNDKAWNRDFEKWSKQIGGYAKFRGKPGSGGKTRRTCLNFDGGFERLGVSLRTRTC